VVGNPFGAVTEAADNGTFIVLYGAPGCGKTSLAGRFPKPLFIIASDEQGIHILKKRKGIDNNIPVVELPPLWSDGNLPARKGHPAWYKLLDTMDIFLAGEHDRRTLVIDTGSGIQSILFQHVMSLDYDGDDSAKSDFYSFQKGYEVAAARYWNPEFLTRCNAIVAKGYNVLILSHASMVNVPNPSGPDYKEFRPALQMSQNAVSILGATSKCCHAILFMTDLKEYGKAEPDKKRSRKIVESISRIIGTTAETWFLAKNWHALTEHIEQGTTADETWSKLNAVFGIS
jgi:hypothetical protein